MSSVIINSGSHISFTSQKQEPLIVGFLKKHFLSDNCQGLFELLFQCPDSSSRLYIAKVVARLLNRAFAIWGVCSESEKDKDHHLVHELYKIIHEIMQTLLLKLHERDCQKNWSRLANYFTLLFEVGTGGRYQTEYFLKNFDYIVDICDVMLGSKSPKAALESEPRISMGGSVSMTPFGPLVALASHLVRSMHTKAM